MGGTKDNDVDRLAHRILEVLAQERAAPEDALYALAHAQRVLAEAALRAIGWSWIDAASMSNDLAYILVQQVLRAERREHDGVLPATVLDDAVKQAAGVDL